MTRFRFNVATMGCKANLTDSEALESRLRAMGGEAVLAADADVYILNTCTVTDQADKEARSLLRKSKASLTVAAGCLAEVAPESFSEAQNNLLVIRNSAKEGIATAIEDWLANTLDKQKKIFQGDREQWHEAIDFVPGAASQSRRTRAFLKVQDGCNAFCSYCIIPRARGRSRSLSASEVVSEVNNLVDGGIKEIVLTAIHAADYESEGLDYTGLVQKILDETKVPRIRLTSLDPGEIPDRLLDLMASNPRLCPHFHVSMQSANSRVLTGMKRGYDAAAVDDRLLAIQARLPHSYVGMDMIAGFPGETAEEFEDSIGRLERLPWTKLHVFPFSERQGTAAARLVAAGLAVPSQEIHARAKRLRNLSAKKMAISLQSKVGSIAEVLVEEKEVDLMGRRCSQGHTRSYHKVLIPGRHPANEFVRVRMVGVADRDTLKGEMI